MHDFPVLTHGVIWVAFAFLLFVALFGAKIARVVTGTLDARVSAIRVELEEASRLRAEAEAMLDQARVREEEARAEAIALLATARAEAGQITRTMAEDAAAAGARQERMMLDRIAAAEAAVVTELRRVAIDLATESSRRMLAGMVDDAADAALVGHAIVTLPGSLRAA